MPAGLSVLIWTTSRPEPSRLRPTTSQATTPGWGEALALSRTASATTGTFTFVAWSLPSAEPDV
jgi:hypothetical protein